LINFLWNHRLSMKHLGWETSPPVCYEDHCRIYKWKVNMFLVTFNLFLISKCVMLWSSFFMKWGLYFRLYNSCWLGYHGCKFCPSFKSYYIQGSTWVQPLEVEGTKFHNETNSSARSKLLFVRLTFVNVQWNVGIWFICCF
jgi:hypothetical protein